MQQKYNIYFALGRPFYNNLLKRYVNYIYYGIWVMGYVIVQFLIHFLKLLGIDHVLDHLGKFLFT